MCEYNFQRAYTYFSYYSSTNVSRCADVISAYYNDLRRSDNYKLHVDSRLPKVNYERSSAAKSTMGQNVATVRSMEDSDVELKERLMFVESVANRHLDAKLGTLFQGSDEEGGFTLEIHKRVNVQIGEDDESVYSALRYTLLTHDGS